jgi:hypothetical protein
MASLSQAYTGNAKRQAATKAGNHGFGRVKTFHSALSVER